MPDFLDKAMFIAGTLGSGDVHLGWIEFKDYLSEITNLHQDALHIYAAVLTQLMAALVLRRSLASFIPWVAVLLVLVGNEWLDLTEPGRPIEEWQVLGGLRDVWNTMAVPTILLVIARFAPSLLTGRKGKSLPRRSSAKS